MKNISLIKAVVFIACLLPFAQLLLAAFDLAGQSLGANPIEELLHQLGLWGLRLLLLTLAITPLRRMTGKSWLLKLRRMLGLFSFFYVSLHFLTYAILDQGFSFGAIGEDILERPYITLGISALLMLIPLAVTSTNGWMRRLGRGWEKLHQLVYLIATLGVWHFFWQVKLDTREPLVYVGMLAVLLGYRVWVKRNRKTIFSD